MRYVISSYRNFSFVNISDSCWELFNQPADIIGDLYLYDMLTSSLLLYMYESYPTKIISTNGNLRTGLYLIPAPKKLPTPTFHQVQKALNANATVTRYPWEACRCYLKLCTCYNKILRFYLAICV